MNSMFDLIVGKDVAYKTKTGGGTIADINEVDLLAPGAVAIFAESGLMVETATTAAALADVKSFRIAVGRATDVKVSQLIDRDAFHRAKCAYQAAVLQLVTLTPLNLPATFTANEEGEITVYQRQPGIEPAVAKERFSVSATIVDTPTTYLQKMVDKINAGSKFVNAVIVTPGVSFTLEAKKKNQTFEVGALGVLGNAVITYTTPPVFSVGDGDDLVLLESEGQIYDGDTSPYWFPRQLFSQPDEVVSAETYVCYQFNWEQESMSAINSQNSTIQGLSMFLPDGAAVVADIDTILATLVTVIPSTGSGGSPFSTL
jgi:hypothetical protein